MWRILLCLLFASPTLIFAEQTALQQMIQDLRVESVKEKELIHLQFVAPYQEIPSMQYEVGFIEIMFPKTEFDSKLKFRRINDQFIKSIQLKQEGQKTIFVLYFSSDSFNPEGLIFFEQQENSLVFTIYKNKEALPQKLKEPSLIEQDPLSFKPESSRQSAYSAEDGMTGNIIKMLLALFFVLLVLYGLLWLYNKFVVKKFSLNRGKYKIKLASSYHINTKQKIVVLEVNDKAYACGITPNNINVISQVSEGSFVEKVSTVEKSKEPSIDYSQLRGQYLDAKKSENEVKERESEKRRTFSSELRERVKKLKPID